MKKRKLTPRQVSRRRSLKRTGNAQLTTRKRKLMGMANKNAVVPMSIFDMQAAEDLRCEICVRFISSIKRALYHSRFSVDDLTGLNIYMLIDCIIGDYPDYNLNYRRIMISRGTIDPPYSPSITLCIECRSGIIEWLRQLDGLPDRYKITKDDQMFILIYNESKECACFIHDIAKEDLPMIDFDHPFDNAKDKFHGWVFGKKRDADVLSDSIYVKISAYD